VLASQDLLTARSRPPDEQTDLVARLNRIKKLTDELVQTQADSAEARALAERIKRELDRAKGALKPTSNAKLTTQDSKLV
jgi:hypothetical protein